MNDMTILLIQFVISIIANIILFKIFENKGFGVGFLILLLAEFALSSIGGTIVFAYNLGMKFFLVFLAIKIISTLIIAGIEFFVFEHTSGIFAFIMIGGFTVYLASYFINEFSKTILKSIL